MTTEAHSSRWQQIGWNGLLFQLPETWQPTVIYPDYLFFEQEGTPVFEIKWQTAGGQFSPHNTLAQLDKSLPDEVRIDNWDLPPVFQQLFPTYTVSGFQIEHEKRYNNGMIIFCPRCDRIILVQWYIDTERNSEILSTIFRSIQDHTESTKQVWSIYDINVKLPKAVTLRKHEFVPGKYTLCFEYGKTTLTLYRFKPAAVILNNTSLGTFGQDLLDRHPKEEGEEMASWQYQARGIDLLLAKLRRKPLWNWMRLWHDPKQNVILGIKAEGKRLTDTGWLETVCENFTSA